MNLPHAYNVQTVYSRVLIICLMHIMCKLYTVESWSSASCI